MDECRITPVYNENNLPNYINVAQIFQKKLVEIKHSKSLTMSIFFKKMKI